jgi:hypothetical protein
MTVLEDLAIVEAASGRRILHFCLFSVQNILPSSS